MSRPSHVQDYNHNDVEIYEISSRDPEAVSENGRGIRRPCSNDDFMDDNRSMKRRRVDKFCTIADNAHTAFERIVDDGRISDEALASIPFWMRNNVVRRYRYKDNRTLQPIIEVCVNHHSDDEDYSDDAIDSSDGYYADIDMPKTDDENEMEVDEVIEEDNNIVSDSGVSCLSE